MKISVLMSTYNGEKYIADQIDSILAQTGLFNVQICIRDDGSTDATQVILEKYASKNLIKWYSGKNIGPSRSFIDLLLKNTGSDFYAFSDQDDFWFPQKLESAIKMLIKSDKKHPALYCSNADIVDQHLKSLDRVVYKHRPATDFYTLSCAGGLLGCTMVFNDSLAKAVQKLDKLPERGIYLHDFFVSLLCASLNGKIIYDSRPQLSYRQHQGNVVGVPANFFEIIKNRLYGIITPSKISIAQQAQTILDVYHGQLQKDNSDWLQKVADYRCNFLNALLLSFSAKTKYASKNMGIRNRILIVMRKR